MISENLLTRDIIRTSLENDLGTEAKLVSWSVTNCTKETQVFFNVVKRVNITYKKDQREGNISYIVKLNPCKTDDLFNPYRQRAVRKEVFFYHELLPLLNLELEKMGEENLRVPKYIHSFIEPGKEVIVLEDLSVRGFSSFPRELKMDDKHFELMAEETCKLHVASYALKRRLGVSDLREVYPLLIESWFIDEEQREAFELIFIKGMKTNFFMAKALQKYEAILPWLKGLIPKAMKVLMKELEAPEKWNVVCHGDIHRTNVLFRNDEHDKPVEVMVLDWQTVRVAGIWSEINYLFNSSYMGSVKEQVFNLITDTYFNKYKEITSSDSLFTKDELKKESSSNRFGFYICFYLIPLMLAMDDPAQLFKVQKGEDEIPDDENLETARKLLEMKEGLRDILTDYLDEIINSGLWKQ